MLVKGAPGVKEAALNDYKTSLSVVLYALLISVDIAYFSIKLSFVLENPIDVGDVSKGSGICA